MASANAYASGMLPIQYYFGKASSHATDDTPSDSSRIGRKKRPVVVCRLIASKVIDCTVAVMNDTCRYI